MLVCAITDKDSELESPFSHRMCILGPFSALLKMGLIDLDLQGHFGLKRVNFRKFELVCAITRQWFELESPFSHKMCILGPFNALLNMVLVDLDLQGHFGLKWVNFCKFELGRTIIHSGFKLESPYWLNLNKLIDPYRLLGPSFKTWLIDLDLQGRLRQMFTFSYFWYRLTIDTRQKLFWSICRREDIECWKWESLNLSLVYVHSHAFLYAYEPDSLYGRVYIHYVNYYIRW